MPPPRDSGPPAGGRQGSEDGAGSRNAARPPGDNPFALQTQRWDNRAEHVCLSPPGLSQVQPSGLQRLGIACRRERAGEKRKPPCQAKNGCPEPQSQPGPACQWSCAGAQSRRRLCPCWERALFPAVSLVFASQESPEGRRGKGNVTTRRKKNVRQCVEQTCRSPRRPRDNQDACIEEERALHGGARYRGNIKTTPNNQMEMLEMKAADVETRFLVAPVADPMQGERPGELPAPHRKEGKNVQWNSRGLWGDSRLSVPRAAGARKRTLRGLGQRTV